MRWWFGISWCQTPAFKRTIQGPRLQPLGASLYPKLGAFYSCYSPIYLFDLRIAINSGKALVQVAAVQEARTNSQTRAAASDRCPCATCR
jgi:hypothetical protein